MNGKNELWGQPCAVDRMKRNPENGKRKGKGDWWRLIEEEKYMNEEGQPCVVVRLNQPRRGEIMVGCRDAMPRVFVGKSPAHKKGPLGLTSL